MKVAITGATGFIGAEIVNGLAELDRNGRSITLSALVRHELGGLGGARLVRGDLSDAHSLALLVRGADVLIHAATYVGADSAQQTHVNVHGTSRLVSAARAEGVARIVYLSTAGVYGGTFARGEAEVELAASPRSALSRSRRDAEELVLAHGGAVVRPNMVTGRGDRWFLAPLLGVLGNLDAWIENGSARVSVISTSALGSAMASLAVRTTESGVFNAASPEPVTIRDLVTPVYALLERPLPSRSIGFAEARDRLAPYGITETALAVIAQDNWFDSSKLWRSVSGRASERPPLLSKDAEWYAKQISKSDAPNM